MELFYSEQIKQTNFFGLLFSLTRLPPRLWPQPDSWQSPDLNRRFCPTEYFVLTLPGIFLRREKKKEEEDFEGRRGKENGRE